MKPFIVIFFFLKNHAESLLIGGLEKKFPWISIIIGESYLVPNSATERMTVQTTLISVTWRVKMHEPKKLSQENSMARRLT